MRKFHRLIICIIILLLANSCKIRKDSITDEEIYYFLNEVMNNLSIDYKECDAISDELLKTIDGTYVTFPGEKYDSSKTIRQLAEYGYIDSIDINFILQQQVESNFIIEQKRIEKRILNQEKLDSIFNLENDVGYEVLRNEYGIKCIGQISKPFFSKDKNTVLISLEWSKGYLYGQGLIIIFKRENGVWKEEQVFGTWES